MSNKIGSFAEVPSGRVKTAWSSTFSVSTFGIRCSSEPLYAYKSSTGVQTGPLDIYYLES